MAERILEEAVIRIKPSFVGFESALRKAIKEQDTRNKTQNIGTTIGVKVTSVGLEASLRKALKEQNAKNKTKGIGLTVGVDVDLKAAEKKLQAFHKKWNKARIVFKVDTDRGRDRDRPGGGSNPLDDELKRREELAKANRKIDREARNYFNEEIRREKVRETVQRGYLQRIGSRFRKETAIDRERKNAARELIDVPESERAKHRYDEEMQLQRSRQRQERQRRQGGGNKRTSRAEAIAISPERLLTMPPVIAALGPAAIVAAGGIAAIGSALVTAGAGVAVFAGAVAANFKDIKKVFEDTRNGAEGVFAPLAKQIDTLKAQYKDFQSVTRVSVVGVFTAGLQAANSILPKTSTLVTGVGMAITGLLNKFTAFSMTDQFKEFMTFLADRAPAIITSFGNILGNLGQSVIGLVQAFDPLANLTLGGLEGMTESLAKWSAGLATNQGFQSFVEAVAKYGPLVVSVIGNVVSAFGKLIMAVAPVGILVLNLVNNVAKFIKSLDTSTIMIAVGAFAALYLAIKSVAISLAIMRGLTGAIVTLRAFTLTVNGLAASLTAAGVSANFLKGALIATGIGAAVVIVGTLAAALIGLTSGLGDYSSHTEDAIDKTKEYTAAQLELANALLKVGGAQANADTADIRKGIVDELEAAGILRQVKASANIAPNELVDSFFGDRTLWNKAGQDLKARLVEAQELAIAAPGPESAAYLATIQKQVDVFDELSVRLEAARAAAARIASGMGTLSDKTVQANSAMDLFNASLDKTANLAGRQAYTIVQNVITAYDAWQDSIRATQRAREDLGRVSQDASRAEEDASQAIVDANEKLRDSYDSLNDAKRAVVDANDNIAKALDKVKKAQLALTEAQVDALRKMRDKGDNEESLKIALAQAQLTELQTRGLAAGSLERRQAVLGVSTAQKALTDFQQDYTTEMTGKGPKLTGAQQKAVSKVPAVVEAAKGIVEANKDVVDARIAEKKAEEGVRDANDAVAKAKRGATRAEEDYGRTLVSNQRAKEDANETLEDAVRNQGNLKLKYDDTKTAASAAGIEINGANTAATTFATGKYEALITANTDDAKKDISEVLQYVETLKLLSKDPTLSYDKAWATAGATIKSQKSVVPPGYGGAKQPGETQAEYNARTNRRAAGGPIRGRGTGTSDSIPAMLSHGEHVWTAAEVTAAGGHDAVKRIRKSFIHRAKGGPAMYTANPRLGADLAAALGIDTSRIPGFGGAAPAGTIPSTPATPSAPVTPGTGIIGRMQTWARQQAGKVYGWATAGPTTYDCSGLVGNLYAMATGKEMYKRYFTTYDMPLAGWKRGAGRMTMYLGEGHTAANIGGLHAEAYGGNGVPLAIGHIGTPLSYYDSTWHLPGLAAGGSILDELKRNKQLREQSNRERGWPEVKADKGAILPPRSRTLVHNGTSQPEHVGFPGSGETELSSRSIARLAAAINALGIEVVMDDEVVAKRSEKALSDSLRRI